MWWGIGILGFVLWLTLLVILCAATPRRGHWIMFLSGIPLPIFWAIGAPSRRPRGRRRQASDPVRVSRRRA